MAPNAHRLLAFAIRYPEGWHTCGADSVRAMGALEARGYLEVVRYAKARPQFRLALPPHAHAAIREANGKP